MRPGRGNVYAAFEQALDQIDTAAGTIRFLPQHLIGRAHGVAETAMNAGADRALSGLPVKVCT
jgi:hypothetical protein